MMHNYLLKTLLGVTLAVPCGVIAEVESLETNEMHEHQLLGSAGGIRSALSNTGITIDAVITHDLFNVFRGEREHTGGGLGNVDLSATIDTSTAGLWNGGTFFFYGLGNYGRKPSELTGEIQVTDNIETYSTAKLYEAWYEHQLLDGAVSLLFGLHDYNSEFYALDASSNLLNSSFGIGVDVAQVGPSIFSTTALAGRVRVLFDEDWYASAALYDGIPGDPNNSRGTRIRFDNGDGVFSALETGYIGAESNRLKKISLGGWFHTAKFNDFEDQQRTRNSGVYGMSEYAVLHPELDGVALSWFLQAGSARPSVNQVGTYFGTGFQWTAPFSQRPDDALSFGAAFARVSNEYKQFDPDVSDMESIFELNYRAKIAEFFYLTPDIQFIRDPGANREAKDALVGFLRAELSL